MPPRRIGPFVRFFDGTFTLEDVRRIEVSLKVEGEDGFVLKGRSSMREIARDPADLVKQMLGRHHQYPDGAALFLGTMFAPIEDREVPRARASRTNWATSPRLRRPSSACSPTA